MGLAEPDLTWIHKRLGKEPQWVISMYNYIGPTAETEKDTGIDRKNVLGLEEILLNCIYYEKEFEQNY